MPDLSSITAAAAALNALTAQEAAEKDRIDAAVAAALAAIVQPTRRVYLDGVAGLDTNDGTTPAKAVATPQKAFALGSAGQHVDVILCSDVTITAPLAVPLSGSFISDWLAATGADTGQVKRKITLAAGAFAAYVAVNQLWEGGTLIFNGVHLHLNATTTGAGAIGVRNSLQFADAQISWDPGGIVLPLIVPFPLSSIYFAGVQFPSDYAGKIFSGVPAGGNVNTLYPGIRSNLTSA